MLQLNRWMTKAVLVAGALALLFANKPAAGAVSLAMAVNPVTKSGTVVSVFPNSFFSVGVFLMSTTTNTADRVVALSYQVQATGPGGGIFTLTGRDTTTNAGANPFSDTTNTNATVLAASAATLNPSNGSTGIGSPDGDLGGLLSNVASPVSNNFPNGTGTFNPALVATLTFKVAAAAPPGAYTLSVVPILYTDSTFTDRTFSSPPGASPLFQSITVNVPEPTMAGALSGMLLLGMFRLRRRTV